ncbi:hypothetical protein Pam5_58 [Pseudanabaena phage Pam5]|nr:hypothetical protein Pam5_58 [Pseudanabaena phage Pam5]
MSALVPFIGHIRPEPAPRPRAKPIALRAASSNPPLETDLDEFAQDRALAMFRRGAGDTRDIAWSLGATEAAVANALARARDRERAV